MRVRLLLCLHVAAACLDVPPPPSPPSGLVDTGTGKDGLFAIDGTMRLDDGSAALAEPAGASARMLVVSSGEGFAPGDELLVIQMTGDGAGHHESAIVSAVDGAVVTVEDALDSDYPADGDRHTQVVRVPHFTDVTVQSGGLIAAQLWDAERGTGGVIAFRATGSVSIADGGAIDVSTLGFAGAPASGSVAGGAGAAGVGGGTSAVVLCGGGGGTTQAGFGDPGIIGSQGGQGVIGDTVEEYTGGSGGDGGTRGDPGAEGLEGIEPDGPLGGTCG